MVMILLLMVMVVIYPMRSLRLCNASVEMNRVVNLSLRLREHSLVSLMLMGELEVNDGSVNKKENVDEDIKCRN